MNKIDIAAVSSVYSGQAGACCCGCKGNHRYASAHRAWASKNRGYKVADDEVSDRSVKLITGKINARIADAEFGTGYVSLDAGNRVYIAYLAR